MGRCDFSGSPHYPRGGCYGICLSQDLGDLHFDLFHLMMFQINNIFSHGEKFKNYTVKSLPPVPVP